VSGRVPMAQSRVHALHPKQLETSAARRAEGVWNNAKPWRRRSWCRMPAPSMTPFLPRPHFFATPLACACGLLAGLGALPSQAQDAPAAGPSTAWQQCRTLTDTTQRLACYDQWAGGQTPPANTGSPVPAPMASTTPAADKPPVEAQLPATRVVEVTDGPGCKDPQYSDYSRFWELENGTDCGTFGIRGYRPMSLSWAAGSSVNSAPTSPSPGHTAAFTPYSKSEMRIQLSVRTKIAQGLLTQGDPTRRDSVWFGYTQQSYWQLFNGQISRPFRATDHEPELMYVYPLDWKLADGLRLRYGGVGIAHQSNGQSLPLSRSWNRVYLMTGLEKDNTWRVQARLWKRIPESSGNDDNPDLTSFIGRGELSGFWNRDRDNTFGITLRHSLKSDANGSVRVEWLRALGNVGEARTSGLRLHTQLFSGYGDSLIDYNRKRTVFTIGLSLVDF